MTLTFRLTKCQRILNPVERLIYTALLLFLLAPVVMLIIMLPDSWPALILMVAGYAFFWWMLHRPMLSLYAELRGWGAGERSVVVEGDIVRYTIADGVFTMSRKTALNVTWGFCGTSIVRFINGGSITLPTAIMARTELRRLLKDGAA